MASKTEKGSFHVITLEGDLTIDRSNEISELIKKSLKKHESVRIMLKRVGSIDVSFIQVLVAAKRHAVMYGRNFQLTGPFEEKINRIFDLAGVSNLSGDSRDTGSFLDSISF